ncbi:MAG: winged helix-turn-helix transcriptional regulator [Candidatus Bathyarchaeia archaeon]
MRLSRIFGSKAQVKVLEYMLENRGKIFNQASLAKSLNLSPSTISRVAGELAREGIVLEERLDGRMKIFCLNEENEKVKLILDFYEKMKALGGVMLEGIHNSADEG